MFQTEAYAREILSLPGIDGRVRDSDEVATRVALRLRRQEVLTRAERPLWVEAILSEAVLRSPVGGLEVMTEQLHHLVHLSKRRNVMLRVVPVRVGLHLGMTTGTFDVLHFPPGTTAPTVYAHGFLGDAYFKEPKEVAVYTAAYADIAKQALNVKDTGRSSNEQQRSCQQMTRRDVEKVQSQQQQPELRRSHHQPGQRNVAEIQSQQWKSKLR